MPKSKTETHNKLTECMRAEFLEKGFKNASLNNIARTAGITPAAVYKHFENKEAMFEALVSPTLERLEGFKKSAYGEMVGSLGIEDGRDDKFDMFGDGYISDMLDMMYESFDGFYLLLVCSHGTKFQGFADEVVEGEAQSTMAAVEEMRSRGLPCSEVTLDEARIIAEIFVGALFKIVRSKMTRPQAEEYMKLVARLMYPGMREILKM